MMEYCAGRNQLSPVGDVILQSVFCVEEEAGNVVVVVDVIEMVRY